MYAINIPNPALMYQYTGVSAPFCLLTFSLGDWITLLSYTPWGRVKIWLRCLFLCNLVFGFQWEWKTSDAVLGSCFIHMQQHGALKVSISMRLALYLLTQRHLSFVFHPFWKYWRPAERPLSQTSRFNQSFSNFSPTYLVCLQRSAVSLQRVVMEVRRSVAMATGY